MTNNEILSEQHLIRARYFNLEKDESKTFSYLQKSLAADRNNYEAWLEFASLHEQKGNFPDARYCSEQAIDCGRYTSEPLENLARYCDLQGDNLNAIRLCIEAIQIEPENHELYDYLADLSQRFEYERTKSPNDNPAHYRELQDDNISALVKCFDELLYDPDYQDSYDSITILSRRIADKLKRSALISADADNKA